MTPATIIKQAQADGVKLALSPSGSIKAVGNEQAVARWLPAIREHKPAIVTALRHSPEELEVLAWLETIDEFDPVVIGETLHKFRSHPDWRVAFLKMARGEDCGRAQ